MKGTRIQCIQIATSIPPSFPTRAINPVPRGEGGSDVEGHVPSDEDRVAITGAQDGGISRLVLRSIRLEECSESVRRVHNRRKVKSGKQHHPSIRNARQKNGMGRMHEWMNRWTRMPIVSHRFASVLIGSLMCSSVSGIARICAGAEARVEE